MQQFKKLVFSVVIYHIWKGRNAAIFRSASVLADSIMEAIVQEIRHVALAWGKIPKSHESWKLALEWSIPVHSV